jgi:hypothetical protein
MSYEPDESFLIVAQKKAVQDGLDVIQVLINELVMLSQTDIHEACRASSGLPPGIRANLGTD